MVHSVFVSLLVLVGSHLVDGVPQDECQGPHGKCRDQSGVTGQALLQKSTVKKNGVQAILGEEFLANADGSYTLIENKEHKNLDHKRSSATLDPDMQAVLDIHNVYRCMHGVDPMTWDTTIASNAQTWADKKSYGHSPKSDRQNVAGYSQLGENIAWGAPTNTGVESTDTWYDEVIFTNNGLASSCDDGKNGEAICHYTQVAWKTSTKLGCGTSQVTMNSGGTSHTGPFWVCQYGEAGNMAGQFDSHLFAQSKTRAECDSQSGSSSSSATTGSEGTTTSDCQDGAKNHDPKIMSHDGFMACPELKSYCEAYSFVKDKCKVTCNNCR